MIRTLITSMMVMDFKFRLEPNVFLPTWSQYIENAKSLNIPNF